MTIQSAQPTFNDDALTDTTGASILLKIPVKTLQKWRSTGYLNIPYVRIGRKIRYRPSDLKAYVDSHRIGG